MRGKPRNEDLITLNSVVDLIYKLTGVTRKRSTIYSWVMKGRVTPLGQIVKLKIAKRLGRNYTTETWVRKFIEDIG